MSSQFACSYAAPTWCWIQGMNQSVINKCTLLYLISLSLCVISWFHEDILTARSVHYGTQIGDWLTVLQLSSCPLIVYTSCNACHCTHNYCYLSDWFNSLNEATNWNGETRGWRCWGPIQTSLRLITTCDVDLEVLIIMHCSCAQSIFPRYFNDFLQWDLASAFRTRSEIPREMSRMIAPTFAAADDTNLIN